jgi:hypothetical protein
MSVAPDRPGAWSRSNPETWPPTAGQIADRYRDQGYFLSSLKARTGGEDGPGRRILTIKGTRHGHATTRDINH